MRRRQVVSSDCDDVVQVEDIESKLDVLIDMYREDRMLPSIGSGGSGTAGAGRNWSQQSMVPWASYGSGCDVTAAPINSNNKPGDNQHALATDPLGTGNGNTCPSQAASGSDAAPDSESSTPLSPSTSTGMPQWNEDGSILSPVGGESCNLSARNPARPMLRNLSDLGPRIKKRVTYSSEPASTAAVASVSSLTLNQQPPSYVDLCRRPVVNRSSISGPRHQPSIVNEEDEDNSGNGVGTIDNDSGGSGSDPTEVTVYGSAATVGATSTSSNFSSLLLSSPPPPVLVTDWTDKNGKSPLTFNLEALTGDSVPTAADSDRAAVAAKPARSKLRMINNKQ